MSVGFQSIVHQGWFHAKYGGQKVPPQYVKAGRKDDGFQTSAYSDFMRGVGLYQEGKSWKDTPERKPSVSEQYSLHSG